MKRRDKSKEIVSYKKNNLWIQIGGIIGCVLIWGIVLRDVITLIAMGVLVSCIILSIIMNSSIMDIKLSSTEIASIDKKGNDFCVVDVTKPVYYSVFHVPERKNGDCFLAVSNESFICTVKTSIIATSSLLDTGDLKKMVIVPYNRKKDRIKINEFYDLSGWKRIPSIITKAPTRELIFSTKDKILIVLYILFILIGFCLMIFLPLEIKGIEVWCISQDGSLLFWQ